jgi:hypothetical protein
MPRRSRSEEVPPPPLQMIGDLIYSPGTDIPFGKQFRIGLTERTIYESAIEKGYTAGVRAHQTFLKDHQSTTPIMLDDRQFTMIIRHLLPQDYSTYDQGLWRSFFIIGWTCVYLNLEPAVDIDKDIDIDVDL